MPEEAGKKPLIALILAAAGVGSRYEGECPKQFVEFRGRPLYLHSLERFSPFCDTLIIVHPARWSRRIEDQVRGLPYREKILLQEGEERRQDSVRRGLERVPEGTRIVLVHDAARPFVSEGLIARVIEGTKRARACIPVLPIPDTLKQVREDRTLETIDRNGMVLAQTPQGFDLELLRRAFEQSGLDRFHATDEASLVERLGAPVTTIPGERANLKVTWPEDLQE